MAKIYKAAFPQTPKLASAVCTAAKITFNDATNAQPLFTAGGEGSEILRLMALPRGQVTPTKLQLYWSPDNGSTLYLLDSEQMSGYTMETTTATPETPFANIAPDNPLLVPANAAVYVAIGVALPAGIVFTAQYWDY
ncbi:MAG TPA: hypothetical protein VGE72_05075 [Azospirillum sp.]